MEDKKPSANDLNGNVLSIASATNQAITAENVHIVGYEEVNNTNNTFSDTNQCLTGKNNANREMVGKNIECIWLYVEAWDVKLCGDEDTKNYFLEKYQELRRPSTRTLNTDVIIDDYCRHQMCLLREGYKYSHTVHINKKDGSFNIESWIKDF